MRKRTTITILAMLMLSACGGGGGTGQTPVTVVSSPTTPAPAPTPAPTPTPSPTPTPAPAPTIYGTACDGFATNQKAFAMSAVLRGVHSDRSTTTPDAYIYSITDATVENFIADLQFLFDARLRTASTEKAFVPLYAFSASDITASTSSTISYRNGTRTLELTCVPGSSIAFQRYSADLRNPALGVKESVHRAQVTGMPTMTTAETSSGTYVADLPIEIFRTDVLDPARRTEAASNVAPIALVFDKDAGTIRGTYRIGGSEPMDVTIDVTRQIGTRFVGTITAANGATGEISGGFYGPNGREIGFVVAFEKFGFHYAGAGSGRRG
jgi:hypothetical protein